MGRRPLRAANDTLNDITGPDAAGLHKLHGEYNELLSQNKDAQLQYTEALKMLEELDRMFFGLDAFKGHGFHSVQFLQKHEHVSTKNDMKESVNLTG